MHETHNINELLHFSFTFGPNLPHFQRYERTQGISLGPDAYNDEHVAVSKARVTELRAATLVASAQATSSKMAASAIHQSSMVSRARNHRLHRSENLRR